MSFWQSVFLHMKVPSSALMQAVRERDKLRMAMDALSLSERNRPSPPQTHDHSPKATGGGNVSRKHHSILSQSVNDSAIGSMVRHFGCSWFFPHEVFILP